MKEEMWDITRPIPYGKNPRKLTERAIAKVATSIQKFGFRQPIVVDKKDIIIVGHKRLLAAKKLGWPRVPVTIAADLTQAQVKAYRIADNRLSEEGDWDDDLLAEELADLGLHDFDMELTGFDESEIDKIVGMNFDEENTEEKVKQSARMITCPNCEYEFLAKKSVKLVSNDENHGSSEDT